MENDPLIHPRQQMTRLRVIMESDPKDPRESWGVLNPAAARGPDGHLYLFPRVVAEGNYSRIGRARVLFDSHGDPCDVERLGYVLEPEEEYERNPWTGGGCEDPRITFVEPLDAYVMAYTGYSTTGPRVAIAISEDLVNWRRLGLLNFAPGLPVDLNTRDNKDCVFFPEPVIDPEGKPALAVMHRPLLPPLACIQARRARWMGYRQSIWISYCSLDRALRDVTSITQVHGHSLVAVPVEGWEDEKIGGGTPPVKTRHGWLALYHGVSRPPDTGRVFYSAGALVMDAKDPRQVTLRTESPLMRPEALNERNGIVPDVVFPTGLDVRGGGKIDVYYGMADSRIGVARLQVPEELPPSERAIVERLGRRKHHRLHKHAPHVEQMDMISK